MESNEKKNKRPRIGQIRTASPERDVNGESTSENSGEFQQRPYRQDYQGSYQQRNNYGQRPYNQRNNYQQRPYAQGNYQQRPRYNSPDATPASDTVAETNSAETTGENENHSNYRQQGYNPNYRRPQNYNQGYNQGGYNNQNRQGGYNNNRQGSYSNQNRQGGYNNQNRQGGYNNQNRQGGYNNRQGGMRQNQYGMPQGGKSFVPRPKRIEYEQSIPSPDEQIRLNKFLANAGICSRREADEYIQQGLVKVNGEVVTELGTKITHSDTVEYNGKAVALESKCYILLNKPKDCVTTSEDPNGRTTVMDLIKGACEERVYPVGRLDRNTTGVLLLTNDGDLASKLTHPKYVKKKIYHVWTDKDISEDDMQRIADGIELDDGPIHADAISYATDTDRNQAGIEIHSGRNRIVRRIFESLGYHVTKLDRVYFAGLTKKNLPRGRWRYLTQEEVNFLKMGSFE